MCGIIGFFSPDQFNLLRAELPRAVSSLVHRGPDDSGLFFDAEAGVGLGHRRLAIIDLSEAGKQPMSSEDGKVHIVLNGEIYNFKDLRRSLETRGHRFLSETDTEVALKAYMEWGIRCIRRFLGMFALAIWDARSKTLYLVRDRLGIKPLFYHAFRGSLLFASELKALMAFSGFPREIEEESLPLFLHYQYVPAPKTIFRHTHKLPPGHYAMFSQSGAEIRPYWQLPDLSQEGFIRNVTLEQGIDEVERLISQAVQARLTSDVPLGALLSGGVDSSLVVALMQRVSSKSVKTFSIGFKESECNEAHWAKEIARYLGTEHTELYVTQTDALKAIPQLPEIYDEPFADSSAVPTYLVSRLARSRLTVALSGDGGDEQLAGYVRYWTTKKIVESLENLPSVLKQGLKALLTAIPGRMVDSLYKRLGPCLPSRYRQENFLDKWQKLVAMIGQNSLQDYYRAAVCLWSRQEVLALLGRELPESVYDQTFRNTDGWPVMSRFMRADQITYLPDGMLTKVDRASMAVNLEIRVPLLDHRILEYTTRLPDHFKYRNGCGKYLFKELLARYIPRGLFDRPKKGFAVPIDSWIRGGLRDLFLDYLSSERLRKEGLLNHLLVERKLREHLSGQVNHQHRLWSILMWEMWRERWLGAHQADAI